MSVCNSLLVLLLGFYRYNDKSMFGINIFMNVVKKLTLELYMFEGNVSFIKVPFRLITNLNIG